MRFQRITAQLKTLILYIM